MKDIRRMFNTAILNQDYFLDLPNSAKLLYIYLSLNADDEGFISNAKNVIRIIGSTEDDLRVLIAKDFIKEIEENEMKKIYLVTDWFINNDIRMKNKVGFSETNFIEAKEKVKLVGKKYMYVEDYQQLIDSGAIVEVKVIEQKKLRKNKKKEIFTPPTLEEIKDYIKEKGYNVDADYFFNYYKERNWINKLGETMVSWKSTIVTWNTNNYASTNNNSQPKKIDYMKY